MILPFSRKFPNGNETRFDDKICKCLIEQNFDFEGIHEHTPDYLVIMNDYDNIISKKHTIRPDLKNRWKAGNKIHAVYNNRSKNQFQFAPTFECKGIQTIEINYINKFKLSTIYVDGKYLELSQMYDLAKNDGFDDLTHFAEWFKGNFKGKIIHFTDLKY